MKPLAKIFFPSLPGKGRPHRIGPDANWMGSDGFCRAEVRRSSKAQSLPPGEDLLFPSRKMKNFPSGVQRPAPSMDEGRQPGSTSCNPDPSEDISHILPPLSKRIVAPSGDQVKCPVR